MAQLPSTPNQLLVTPRDFRRHIHLQERKIRLLRALELLVIDEVSMLRADTLDLIDLLLRSVRRSPLPFGGVQVLFIGDLMQLPPVVKPQEWDVLRQYYPSLFFFHAHVLQKYPPLYIELTHVYRQQDAGFIDLLNHLRYSALTPEDIQWLRGRINPAFDPIKSEGYVTLTTHNARADEINRTPPKTQSALLEAMEERQVSIDGEPRALPDPFMVIATQNPVEYEGTYPLPEAQLDRFLLKEIITYPAPVDELEVLERIDSGVMSLPTSSEPVSITDVLLLQDLTRRIYVHSTLKAYIVDIINTTRGAGPNPLPGWTKHVRVGASPRGAIALMQISQALALMDGRNYVVPDDIKKLRYGILRHRIIRTFDALADNVSIEGLIDAVFNAVPVP